MNEETAGNNNTNNVDASLPPAHKYVSCNQLTPFMNVASSHRPEAATLLRGMIQQVRPCPFGDDKHDFMIRMMLNQRDKSDPSRSGGYAAIHYAASHGNRETLQVLLDAGADPNLIKNNGCTALHVAIASAGYDHTRIDIPIQNFIECIEVLMRHPEFCLLQNDRHDNDEIAAKVLEKEECVHHDGRGISPAWLCVGQNYSDDVLLPFLKLILARGFDANGTNQGMSALYMALYKGHLECAVALVRAGASITDVICKETNTTVIKMAELNYPKLNLPKRLREAAVVAQNLGYSNKRRDLLRHDYVKGAKKLAERARINAETMLTKGSYKEAAGLLEEALSYNSINQSFTMSIESACMINLSACQLQCNQTKLAEKTARDTLKKFPNYTGAMIALGKAIAHPSRGETSAELWNEVENLVNAAAAAVIPAESREMMISNIKYLQSEVASSRKTKSPAIQAAEIAIKEYHAFNLKKAAVAIDLTLRPELEHPNPLPMRSLKGNINFDLGADILMFPERKMEEKNNNDCDCDSDDAILDTVNQGTIQDWNIAEEKIKIALVEFEYCLDNSDNSNNNGGMPSFLQEWNVALSLVALGRIEEGSKNALSSIQIRQEIDRAHLNGSTDQKKIFSNVTFDIKLIDALLHAVKISKIFLQQRALKRMESLLRTALRASTISEEMDLEKHSVSNLVDVVTQVVSLEIIEQSWADDVLECFETNCNDDDANMRAIIVKVLYEAIGETNKVQNAVHKLRADAASLIMETVLSAHQNRKENDVHKTFIGAMINEALEWDAKVKIPSDLQRFHQKISTGCHHCGRANPSKKCHCGVAYCSKQCQIDSWKEHKQICSHRNAQKKKKKKGKKKRNN